MRENMMMTNSTISSSVAAMAASQMINNTKKD